MGEFVGREVEVEVSKIAHGGIAVGRVDGRVVFVADAIPGETVRARISDDRKKSFWRAETVEVLQPSEHRREHVWAAASLDHDPRQRAGGAEFGHIALPHQRELKRQVLAESLQRMAGIDSDVTVDPLQGDPGVNGLGWRTRVSLHVDPEGRLGPMAARSHTVIPVQSLPLATAAVQGATPFGERFVGLDRVEVMAPTVGSPRLVIGEQKPTVIREQVGDRTFQLDDTGFWQVHREAPIALTRAVQEAVDEQLFDPRADNLDLYGGVGLLAAALADRFGSATRVTSVESDPRATDHASENLAEFIGAGAETGRVDRWLRARESAGSLAGATVILDPPRSGAGADVIASLGRLAPAQLVYVACDPVALSRDVALAAEQGYRLSRIRAFDLFPHTHHVEAVATLVRESAAE